eukprot:323362_1
MASSFSKSLGNAWQSTKKATIDVTKKAKKATIDAKKKAQKRLTMEGLLSQARISLEDYLDPKIIASEERMSQHILRSAIGIAFITEAKGGFIVGIKGGSGIIMVKEQSKSQWSAPCAVGTGGLSVGFLAGAAKVDHIIILSSQDQINIFLSNGQLQLKGNANATAAKWGRNAEAGIGVGVSNKQSVAPFYTYSFGNKGLYGGVSFDGEVLAVRKDCNAAFYYQKVDVKDILLGATNVKRPEKNKDYNALVTMLNKYCDTMEDDEAFVDDNDIKREEQEVMDKNWADAVTKHRAVGIKGLHFENPSLINAVVDSSGCTAIHYAVHSTNEEILLYLLLNGASVNAQGGPHHNTALHEAVLAKNDKAVQLLYSYGINDQIRNNDNQFAIDLCCDSDHKTKFIKAKQCGLNLSKLHPMFTI